MAERVDCRVQAQRELYETNTLEECCDYMNEYGQDALGCDVVMTAVEDPFDDDDLNGKTNLIYDALYTKNKYKSFTLKKNRLNDRAGWCQHQGWNQGDLNSDCFLDSTLFAFFGNDTLSTDLSILLDKIYHNPPSENLRKIAYIMALYAEYLKVGEEYRGGKLDTSNVEVSDININFKQAMKWCLIWYSIMEFKNYHDNTSSLYQDIIFNKIVETVVVKNFDVDGGEPLMFLKIFSVIFENHDDTFIFKIADPRTHIESGESSYTYTNENNIDDIIDYNLNISKNIVIIPYYGTLPDLPRVGRMQKVFNNHKASFEAIIQGNGHHVTAFTRCNDKWLEYNNMGTPTTRVWENSINAHTSILTSMRGTIETGTNLIIMKKRELSYPTKSRARTRRKQPTIHKGHRRGMTLRSGLELEGVRGALRKRKSKGKKSRKPRKSKKNTKRRNRRLRTARKILKEERED